MNLEEEAPKLSICIATYNRGGYISQTLDSFLPGLPPAVEVLVVDGASPDDTMSTLTNYVSKYPALRYFREGENSGIDADYDKAVGYARGEYCWLMTDDDLLASGAVRRVLDALSGTPDLLVVGADVRTADLTRLLNPNLLPAEGSTEYETDTIGNLFADVGSYLSFIGAVIVRRVVWLCRQREKYYGSLFIHVGTLFQAPPLTRVRVLRDPLITIRYGNAMWTARGFEIWMFKWPSLVWSFEHLPPSAKHVVTKIAPYRSMRLLLWYRAIGAYSKREYHLFLRDQLAWPGRAVAFLIASTPLRLANGFVGACFLAGVTRSPLMAVYDLARPGHSTWLARLVSRRRGLS